MDLGTEFDSRGLVDCGDEVVVFGLVDERLLQFEEVGGEEDVGAEGGEEGVEVGGGGWTEG